MFTKEEIKNSIQNIVNLSNEDPEEIYVTKYVCVKETSYEKSSIN